jgi:hypothetical protein
MHMRSKLLIRLICIVSNSRPPEQITCVCVCVCVCVRVSDCDIPSTIHSLTCVRSRCARAAVLVGANRGRNFWHGAAMNPSAATQCIKVFVRRTTCIPIRIPVKMYMHTYKTSYNKSALTLTKAHVRVLAGPHG